MTTNLAPRYKVILRDTNFEILAVFDEWRSLTYTRKINNVGAYAFDLGGADSRIDLFDVDYILEIQRSVPGMGLGWYPDFIGFHRYDKYNVADNGDISYGSAGVGINDLLSRRIINYPEGTVKAYKYDISETVMKAYVYENCGAGATLANEREIDGVMPNFEVELDDGNGILWEGDRAFENLLDVLRDVGDWGGLDFEIVWDSASKTFMFITAFGQLGLDRTILGLVETTGLNDAGNAPTVFSTTRGNVSNSSWENDRMSEATVVSVLGEGDGATRLVKVRQSLAIDDSKWNQREIARTRQGYESEMEVYGDEVLADSAAKEALTFDPIYQEYCMYGIHYDLGDRVTYLHRGEARNKRIIEVTNTISPSADSLSLVFSDLITT